jgi:predicted class III extradiol MEMO1 family dioxygenase
MEVTTKIKNPPEVLNKEVKVYRKMEKLEKNLGTIKANIEIVKELLEPEYIYEEDIVMDSKSL